MLVGLLVPSGSSAKVAVAINAIDEDLLQQDIDQLDQT